MYKRQVIILLVASVLQNLMKYAGVNAVLGGVRPCVVAMILATAINMALSTLLGFAGRSTDFVPDARSIAVFVLLWACLLYTSQNKCTRLLRFCPQAGCILYFRKNYRSLRGEAAMAQKFSSCSEQAWNCLLYTSRCV